MAEVRLVSVDKRYGDKDALTDTNLLCEDGEFLVVFGPSGAGKTTLLKLIAGIEEPTEGEISIGDRRVDGLPPQDRNVAMAFESYALYPHLSVRRNLEFPLRARRARVAEPELRERVRRISELLEISELLDRKPSQLSGGQRQRVSLGRALAKSVDVTLLDEPIAHLDALLRHALRPELRHYQKEQGGTTIYTTPDYIEAFGVADRVAVLVEGRIEQVDTPERVYEAPATVRVAALVGDPRMNLLPVTDSRAIALDGQAVEVPPLRALKLGVPVSHIGVRPTDVGLSPAPTLDPALTGVVYVAEPIGNEQVVRVDVGRHRVTAKVPLEGPPLPVGQRVWLLPRWERVHAFATDGHRIRDLDGRG